MQATFCTRWMILCLTVGNVQSGGADPIIDAERFNPADTRAGHVPEDEAHVAANGPRSVIYNLAHDRAQVRGPKIFVDVHGHRWLPDDRGIGGRSA